jgi:LysR family hydrogen peroxide-inducible transcriptional activator
MQPTYRQIEYLRAVAECQSFSGAAKICNVTQSTLSAGVKELENILGVQLFVRTSRDVYLTPEGQVLYEDSHKLFEDMTQFVQVAKGFGSERGGVIRVGIIPTIAPYLIRQLYRAMQDEYPDMHIHIHEDVSAALVERLNKRNLDIVILAFPYPIGSYGHDIIGHDALHLVAHKSLNIPSKAGKINMLSMQDVPMIMLADGHCLRDHALAACSLGSRNVMPAYQAVTMASLMEMVGAGLGATLVPSLMLESRKGSLPDDVVVYDFESPAPERQIGIVWQRRDLKPYALNMRDICQGMLQRR